MESSKGYGMISEDKINQCVILKYKRMKRFKTILLTIAILAPANWAVAQKPLPIIDMHLHAINVDANGPVPTAIGRGNPGFPDFDPEKPWMQTFLDWMANPKGENPIVSPTTND
jgi:hypothetical protein